MDNFSRLSDEGKEQNKKTNSAFANVDKERIERLKKNFLPSWMRWMEGQEQDSHGNSHKTT
jgi:hypothetical protein